MRTFLIIVGIFVVVMGTVGALIFFGDRSRERQVLIETAEAPAELISSQHDRRGLGKYSITYRYTVNGRVYERNFDTSDDGKYVKAILREKAMLKACYNPANPNESHIWQSEFRCGSKPDW